MQRLRILAVPVILGKLQVGQYSQSVQGQGTGGRDAGEVWGDEAGTRVELVSDPSSGTATRQFLQVL